DALYDFDNLSEEERQQIIYFALIPAVYYPLSLLTKIFNSQEDPDFIAHIESLASMGWIAYEEEGYRACPVVQKIILQKNENSLMTKAEPLIFALDYNFAID